MNSSAGFFPGIDTGEATLMQIFWLMQMDVQARIYCTSCSRPRQSSSGWEHFLCQIQTVCESPWLCFSENQRDVFSGTGSLATQSCCNQFLPNSVEPPPSCFFPQFSGFRTLLENNTIILNGFLISQSHGTVGFIVGIQEDIYSSLLLRRQMWESW